MESQLGSGTRFELSFPEAAPVKKIEPVRVEAAAAAVQNAAASGLRKFRSPTASLSTPVSAPGEALWRSLTG